MYFCPVCKSVVEEGDLFCSTCGHDLSLPSSDKCEEPVAGLDVAPDLQRGIILTDTSLLANRLRVESSFVLRILRRYIQLVSDEVAYELLDLTATPSSDGRYGQRDWRCCHEILFRHVAQSDCNGMQYLFIIGDDSIVPVPQCSVPLEGGAFLATDALYAHSLQLDGQLQVPSMFLLSQPVHFLVGRLPMGVDTTFDQLQNYLERAASVVGKGIPVQMAYAHTLPQWELASAGVSRIFREYLAPVGDIPGYVSRQMVLSPNVTTDNISRVFNPYANLFYFNLHGSDVSSRPSFYGEQDEKINSGMVEAVRPNQLNDAVLPNILVTEACFGGKYSGLRNSQSMLLTAIYSSTLLYVGASTLAYGQSNMMQQRSGMLMGADKLAELFISSLIDGHSAGVAMHLTRKELLGESCLACITYNLLTALEFSLYGDPSLRACFPAGGDMRCPIPAETCYGERITQTARSMAAGPTTSLLDSVRQIADRELEEMKQHVRQELESCGIIDSRLTSVTDFNYGFLKQRIFSYRTPANAHVLACVTDDDFTQIHLVMAKQAELPRIDYDRLFREACGRYGLIEYDDIQSPQVVTSPIEAPVAEQVASPRVILLDRRMEPKSKKLIDTFNTVLDTIYRPTMNHSDIPAVAVKSCSYDFMVLVSPLAVVLETELRASVVRYMESRKVERPEGWMTLGKTVKWMTDNSNVVEETGITPRFLNLLHEAAKIRNESSHSGDISERDFTQFYKFFLRIMTSDSFDVMMKLKRKLRNKNNK